MWWCGHRSLKICPCQQNGGCRSCCAERTGIYDAVPTIVTDPDKLAGTAGSLHCGTLLLAKVVQKFQKGSPDKKLAVTVKGCDLMALHELAKRKGVNLSNLLLIGVNCGGTVSRSRPDQ